MHGSCRDWVANLKAAHPTLFKGKDVVEFGSFDVNGGIRDLFAGCMHVGVDRREGPGVDVVSAFSAFKPDRYFDVGISLNTFEHDHEWALSVRRLSECIKTGGALILSVACGWGPHEPAASSKPGYYENRTLDDIVPILQDGVSWEVFQGVDMGQDATVFALGRGAVGEQ